MRWKTAASILLGLSLASGAQPQSKRSLSSFDTFLTDGANYRARVKLVGEPNPQQLDKLLPQHAKKMLRVVMLCDVDGERRPRRCRRDPSFPTQFGSIAVAQKTLQGVTVSEKDTDEIRRRGLRLQVALYLDDPARELDRSNPWVVPIPPPPPPPAPPR